MPPKKAPPSSRSPQENGGYVVGQTQQNLLCAALPWHQDQWQRCLDMQTEQRLSHAFLLRGPQGTGKCAFALRWANALVCQSDDVKTRPCGHCRGCVLFEAGTHPDVRIITPPPDKKIITVAQIRELIDYVWLSRQLADRKIVVLPDAQDMNISAANTLLKTLEEPPGDALFLLTSHQNHRLPLTIRSRCQFIDFPLPDEALTLPWLQQQLPIDADAMSVLRASGGAPLFALTYWENDTMEARRKFDLEATGLLLGRIDPISAAENWQTLGASLVLNWLTGYVTDLIRLGFVFSSGASGKVDADRAQNLQIVRHSTLPEGMEEVASRLGHRHGYRLLDNCLKTRRMWADSVSLNERMLLEGLAVDLSGAI